MAAGQWVIDVGEHDFEARVVDRSHEVPVVVDFWAPWCGPCRTLGPLLEAAVKRRSGAVVLAKVNVDDNQRLATAFQVEGIPFVVAFRGGKPVLSFTGLLGEPDLEAFLDRLAPSAADKAVADARALEAGSPAAAEKAYRDQLTKAPGHAGATVGLVRVLLDQGRDGEVGDLLEAIEPGSEEHAEAERLRARRELRTQAAGLPPEAELRRRIATDPVAPGPQHQLGLALAAQDRYPEALDALLAAAERDKAMARGPVREAMLKVFQVVGMRSDLADDYRARLQRLLY